MDMRFLKDVLDEAVQHFDQVNHGPEPEEDFKFTALATFQREWELEAADFADMFRRATGDAIPLLDTQKNAPNAGIIKLLELGRVEEVREAFRALLREDGGDLQLRQDRLRTFTDKINALEQATPLKGQLYKLNLYTAVAYMNLWRPQENFFIKISEARTWCLTTNYSPDIGTGVKFSLERYYAMCQRFLVEVRKNASLMTMSQQRAEAKGCKDPVVAGHLLMYDLIHCASSYIFVDKMGLDISKIDRIKATKELYMERRRQARLQEELSTLETQSLLDRQLLVGKAVSSKRFGPGTIKALEGDTLTVAFADQVKYFDLKTCLQVNLLGLEESCYEAYRKDLQLREAKRKLVQRLAEQEE